MVNVRLFVVNENETNAILIWDETNLGIIVDPGFCTEEEFSTFMSFVSQNNIQLTKIILTHGHYDHIAGVKVCCNYFNIPVYVAKTEVANIVEGLEICKLKKWELCHDDNLFVYEDISLMTEISFGKQIFQIIQTPGHSCGSISIYSKTNKLLLSGDCIFYHNYGRTDFDDGDYDTICESIIKILSLPIDTYIIPGHGRPTTIGEEINNNPIIKQIHS